MVRIQIKGGIWKNSEDEVLKAAVMKYGLNNWSRVSSLLVRKTAKQCKARWYEWLDPSVKKTEWTKDEDEKLLHLAKCFPCQWRTIAPVVGRTSNQCLERYERLLDIAQNREMTEDDPRKLRPGEVDPHPHTKPARADAQDMDEDELEMLTEARARLANTRGKKAKRKAREKQLGEARRLAQLQKSRELKAAGVSQERQEFLKRRRRQMDYAREIPFLQEIPKGFHETGPEENPISQIGTGKVALQQIEQKRRDREEQIKRAEDNRKLKKLQKENLAEHMEIVNKMNDPASTRKRVELDLPAPMLEEWELQALAKHGEENLKLQGAAGGLIQSYETPMLGGGNTPGQTPLTQSKLDVVLLEAQNAAKRNEMQTPLDGEDNPQLHDSDFTGVLPQRMRKNDKAGMTPGGMTPSIGFGSSTPGMGGMTPGQSMHGGSQTPGMTSGGMTPGHSGQSVSGMSGMTPGGMTGGRTPGMYTPRDGLGLASEMDPSEAQNYLQGQIRNAFANLPKPSSMLEVTMPANLAEDADDDGEPEIIEDADAKAARLQREKEAEEKRKLLLASLVVQRNLLKDEATMLGKPNPDTVYQLPMPKLPNTVQITSSSNLPLAIDEELAKPAKNFVTFKRKAETKLIREIQAQVIRDAYDFGSVDKATLKRPADLNEDLRQEELTAKRKVLELERELLIQELAEFDAESGDTVRPSYPEHVELTELFEDRYLPQLDYNGNFVAFTESDALTPVEKLNSYRFLFERQKQKVKNESQKSLKREKQLSKVWGSEFIQLKQAKDRLQVLEKERLNAVHELAVFDKLQKDEDRFLKKRKIEGTEMVEQEKLRNKELQAEFAALEKVKRELTEMLA
ncbi:unnamed protein product [Amoebophrya sp. A120]|nr:unnamed protein product [Amoebophrya sp. A120]|eukprot:GSA120T00019196001.1